MSLFTYKLILEIIKIADFIKKGKIKFDNNYCKNELFEELIIQTFKYKKSLKKFKLKGKDFEADEESTKFIHEILKCNKNIKYFSLLIF